MKNLKKVLALVTVVAVLLTCVPAFAVSYSDVAATASYAEAVEMTSALGIFTGYEDGTFLPDKTITRAEAAAVITRFLGQEDTAKAMAGTTQFTDMADAAWASGYVNYGVQKGYINGMGDGTYAPSSEVTYEQIVKMIVAALGYTIKAEANGGYPSGYLAVASQLGITKGTSGSNGAASRATVARLTYNALTVPTMYISKYNSDGTKEYSEDGEAVLYGELKVTEYVGIITDTYMIGLTDIEADQTVTVKYEEVNGEEETGSDEFLVGTTDAADYLGYLVTVYVAENEETGDDEIIAVAAKGNKNDVVVVKTADFRDTGAGYVSDADTVYYWKNKDADKEPTDLVISGAKAYENYATANLANVDWANLAGGTVTFISNDGDADDYEYVIINIYDEEFVVEEIDEENNIITGTEGESLTVDSEDENTLYIIVKDGAPADFADIAVGDTISRCGEGGIVVLNVSSNVVEGTVTQRSKDGSVIVIDGTEYEKTDSCDDIALGAEGTFYLNVDGLIVAYEAEVDATGFYGYFIAAEAKNSFGKATWTVKFVDENGSEVDAKLATRVKFGEGVVGSTSIKSEDVKDSAEGAALDLYNFLDGSATLFKYDTNAEGEITKIITADGANEGEVAEFNKDKAEFTGRYDEEENKLGKVYFDDATVVFSVPAEGEIEAEDVKVTTVGAIFKDGEDSEFPVDVYDMDKNDVAACIVAKGASVSIDDEANVVVVTKTTDTKVEDHEATVIYGLQGGEEVSYTVCTEVEDCDGAEAVDGLKKGDVIMVGEGIEYLNAIRVMKDVDDMGDSAAAFEEAVYAPATQPTTRAYEEELTVKVAAKKNGKLTLADSYVDWEDGEVDALSLANKNGITYTLVNLVNDANITVAKSSFSKINPASRDYDYVIYVRSYDETIIDVVIYQYAKAAEATPAPEATATPAPEATATPEPVATATPEPVATATPEPVATATPEPVATATPEPVATATPEPVATATPAPSAGSPLALNPYKNNGVTDGEAGSYDLSTSAGDCSMYWWADTGFLPALNDGKTVVLTLTYDIPAINVDDCFFFGYMQTGDHNSHFEICDLTRGTSGSKEITLTNVDGTYYFSVDGATPWDFEIAAANVWNFGVYSKNAAGHANTANVKLSGVVLD